MNFRSFFLTLTLIIAASMPSLPAAAAAAAAGGGSGSSTSDARSLAILQAAFETGAIQRASSGADAYGFVFDTVHPYKLKCAVDDIRFVENTDGAVMAVLLKEGESVFLLSLVRKPSEELPICKWGASSGISAEPFLMRVDTTSPAFMIVNGAFTKFTRITLKPSNAVDSVGCKKITLSLGASAKKPTLSPYGKWVAALDEETKKVAFLQPEGIDDTRIQSISLKEDESLDKIKFNKSESITLVLTNKRLYLIHLTTGNVTTITHTSDAPWATFGPQGSTVLYGNKPAGAHLIKVTGTSVEKWEEANIRRGKILDNDHVLFEKNDAALSVWADPYATGNFINSAGNRVKKMEISRKLERVGLLREDNSITINKYDGTGVLFEPKSSAPITTFEINDAKEQVVTVAEDKYVRILDINTGRLLHTLQLLEIPRTLRCHKEHIIFQDSSEKLHIFNTSFLSFTPEQQAFILIAYDQQTKYGKFDFRTIPGVTEAELNRIFERFTPEIQRAIKKYITIEHPGSTPPASVATATGGAGAAAHAPDADGDDDPTGH